MLTRQGSLFDILPPFEVGQAVTWTDEVAAQRGFSAGRRYKITRVRDQGDRWQVDAVGSRKDGKATALQTTWPKTGTPKIRAL